jgi:tRNA/tmRNA/rRNA uracil-C5-methylase (TrmA/RlmC/RlmD family)
VVGPVAHGGHCVARVAQPDGTTRVVFVRHALPDERVRLVITEGSEGDRFWRADAVEVLDASPHRVSAPCAVAGPNGCGGCDFQHVDLAHQRTLKGQVVAEQMKRLAGLDVQVEVEPVPGDQDGLRWRTRQRFVPVPGGGSGMRKHRSHDVVPVEDCLIAGARAVHRVRGVDFDVPGEGFWQVHPGGPEMLVDLVLDLLQPVTGESSLDLYAGVGLFARFLSDATGGPTTLIEGDAAACAAAVRNVPGADIWHGEVSEALADEDLDAVDLVVLDPPRTGAKQRIVDAIADLGPRAVAYVACDPAALARDTASFAARGYRLERLVAMDAFPMTHHVECVALLVPTNLGG